MQYVVRNIGKSFSDKGMRDLEGILSSQHDAGYRFHSVFEVSQPGCLGLGQPSVTYFAIFERIS